MTVRTLLTVFVVCTLTTACAAAARMPVVLDRDLTPAPLPACADAPWCAGAAQVDITPPMGIGMFGHGPESRIATGVQLRLRCQAFVIRGPEGPAPLPNLVALVPCDLAAPGLLLQRSIAARVAKRVPISARQIALMATHTHMGPAHFFAVDSYFGPFSSRLLGFDRGVLNFLADRIASAIVRAYESSVPASLSWSQRPIAGQPIGRNRSYGAFLANERTPEWLQKRVAADPGHAAEQATDPMLAVLSIDRAPAAGEHPQPRRPLGVFAVYGVHPTAVPNTNVSYSGDVFGYATREVEAAIRATAKHDVIVGIANGIEGDVMVARNTTGLREARRVGSLLAAEILASWNDAVPPSTPVDVPPLPGPLAVAYRELRLPRSRLAAIDGTSPDRTLCEYPEIGTPSGGGASDHPTSLRVFPQYNPGVRTLEARPCEGHKLPVIMLRGRGEAGVSLPGTAPISVIRIGTHALVTLPAEITTVAGIRLRESVARELHGVDEFNGAPELDAENPHVVVVGLTNEYLQYVATEEEYALQQYEGASTLYGPHSAEFFRTHAVCLARAHRGEAPERCAADQPAIGVLNAIEYEVPSTAPLVREAAKCDACTLQSTAAGRTAKLDKTVDALTRFGLEFTGPPWTGFVEDDARVRVTVCREDSTDQDLRCGTAAGTWIDDDGGVSVQIAYDPRREVWTAYWLPELLPASSAPPCGNYRILVRSGPDALASEAFTWGCAGAGR